MFEGQPKGLWALALANTGERFGYYTMIAVFALFLRANFGLSAGVAGTIYSSFLMFVYFFPLIGGMLADKFGFGKMVTTGIIVMFLGYLLLSIPLGGVDPATGKMLNGETTYAIDLEKLCKSMGIEDVFVVDAFDLKLLEKTIKEEVAKDCLSVIIAQSPCALLKSYVPAGKCYVDPEKCKKCGACLVPGCPAIKKDEVTGCAVIDDTMCNGCGLCMQMCPFDAISLKKREEK